MKNKNTVKVIIIAVVVVVLLVAAFFMGGTMGRSMGIHSSSQSESASVSSNSEEIRVSDGIFDLITAWEVFMESDTQQTELDIELDFGALEIDEELMIKTGVVDGMQVSHIQRGKLDIYVCDGKVFVEDDNAHFNIQTGEYDSLNMRKMFAIAYEICTKGDFDIKSVENETVYSLTLTQQQIEDILASLQTEQQDINVIIEKGELHIVTGNNQLKEMKLICKGYTNILSVRVDGGIEIEADLSMPSQPVVIPQAVLEQLK